MTNYRVCVTLEKTYDKISYIISYGF